MDFGHTREKCESHLAPPPRTERKWGHRARTANPGLQVRRGWPAWCARPPVIPCRALMRKPARFRTTFFLTNSSVLPALAGARRRCDGGGVYVLSVRKKERIRPAGQTEHSAHSPYATPSRSPQLCSSQPAVTHPRAHAHRPSALTGQAHTTAGHLSPRSPVALVDLLAPQSVAALRPAPRPPHAHPCPNHTIYHCCIRNHRPKD